MRNVQQRKSLILLKRLRLKWHMVRDMIPRNLCALLNAQKSATGYDLYHKTFSHQPCNMRISLQRVKGLQWILKILMIRLQVVQET